LFLIFALVIAGILALSSLFIMADLIGFAPF
jgi:hypothetical protein